MARRFASRPMLLAAATFVLGAAAALSPASAFAHRAPVRSTPVHPGPVKLAPDVDQIIARNIEARGGAAALRAISSLSFRDGVYSENGKREMQWGGHATMRLMRPFYKLVGEPTGKPELLEGNDGSTWEWYADPGVVLRTVGAASAAGRHMTDVDGPWFDYRAKGSRVELVGADAVAGRPTWRLRLTMMDGFVLDGFFDQASGMILAERMSAPIHAFGQEVRSEQRFDDWRPVAGVLFPFRSRTVEIATGKELDAMQWGSIEANLDIPVAWFSPPATQPDRPQTLIQQLFAERDDSSAVLWTWRAYRRAWPDADFSVAGQVAGYQILKAGETAVAIALLEQGALDYPASADTAFGLGRAYAAGGRADDARREYGRALKLDPGHSRARRALDGMGVTPAPKPQ